MLLSVTVSFFSIMADKGTDISNLEKLSFCARTVDDDLNVNEDFLGFYEIDNIKCETVVKIIKDILMMCSLRLNDCRDQTYDGASNMMGKYSGVSTKIIEEQPKAIATLPRPFVEFSGEIFYQRMYYSARHYGDISGNLCLNEVFSETRKNALQANRKCGMDIRS